MPSRSRQNDTTCTRQLQLCRLLALPTEVRAIILRELLYLPTVLGYHTAREGIFEEASRNFKLYPEILCVCRQIHDEGQPLLGTNAMGLNVWIDIYDGTPAMWSFVGCEPVSSDDLSWGDAFWPTDDVAKLWKESLTLHVTVHFLRPANVDYEEQEGGGGGGEDAAGGGGEEEEGEEGEEEEEEEEEEDDRYKRDQLEVVDRLLFTKWNLKVCTLTFDILGVKRNYEPDRDSATGILEPLSLLRCKTAQITGVSAGYAAKITSQMTSATPAINLYAMHDALEKYARMCYYLPEEESYGFDNLPSTWNDVVDSVLAVNVGRFKIVRQIMMDDIEKLLERRQLKVYEQDG